MAVSVLAAWLVGSANQERRNTGFWLFFLSNLLWTVWGVSEEGYALIVMQAALAA